jgi:SAM-dependent methyltransferase
MHELPAPGESVDIVRCAEAAEAARLLIESGRMAHVVDGVSRASTVHNLAPVFRLWRPCPLIESFAAVRQAGAALDIGCGMGRDAVFLASLEWNVTGVDILPGALDRARQLERRCAGAVVSVRWVASEARDFVTSLSSDHPAVFDMIVVVRCAAHNLAPPLVQQLAPGGIIVIEQFTPTHFARHGRPRGCDGIATIGALQELCEGLEVLLAEERDRGNAHVAQLVARRMER